MKYIVSFRELPHGIPLIRHFPEYPSWLYRLERVVPRVYIVRKIAVEKGILKNLDRLSSADFDPLHEVILEQPLEIPQKKNFQAQARIVHYGNSRVIIEASLNGSGVLVLADSFYPGWRVYVDGNENKILRANFFFRGVPLSAGDHLVEFRYQPRSFAIGLVISLLTVSIIVVSSIVFAALERRRSVGNGPTN